MRIPVFVSCPSALSDAQRASRRIIFEQLNQFGLEARTVGKTDYPTLHPLREVLMLARRCSGCVVLGFEQMRVDTGEEKPNTDGRKPISDSKKLPTPWNHLEAGISFSLGLPMLVFRESGIRGGVFDEGVTDLFIHAMPSTPMSPEEEVSLREVFLKWQGGVRDFYYR